MKMNIDSRVIKIYSKIQLPNEKRLYSTSHNSKVIVKHSKDTTFLFYNKNVVENRDLRVHTIARACFFFYENEKTYAFVEKYQFENGRAFLDKNTGMFCVKDKPFTQAIIPITWIRGRLIFLQSDTQPLTIEHQNQVHNVAMLVREIHT